MNSLRILSRNYSTSDTEKLSLISGEHQSSLFFLMWGHSSCFELTRKLWMVCLCKLKKNQKYLPGIFITNFHFHLIDFNNVALFHDWIALWQFEFWIWKNIWFFISNISLLRSDQKSIIVSTCTCNLVCLHLAYYTRVELSFPKFV